MSKLKVFFVAMSLVLITAGVFAGGKLNKITTYNLYAYDPTSGDFNILQTQTFTALPTDLSFAAGNPISITSSNSNSYELYAYDGTTWHQLTSTF